MIGGMLRRGTSIGASIGLAVALGAMPGPAGAEDLDPAPPEPRAELACGSDQQACSTGDGAAWCCPVQATGAMVCCGAVAGVCHACDLEQLPDEVRTPVQPPSPADLPRVE